LTDREAAVLPDKPKPKRLGKKARQAAAAGMWVGRVIGFDDGDKMALERLNKGVVLRIFIPKADATDWTVLRSCFDNAGSPWVIVDRSGLAVEIQRQAVQGVMLKKGQGGLLASLPMGAELPHRRDGTAIRWSNFSKSQLLALALISDLDNQRTSEQIAAVCNVTPEELKKWEGKNDFLVVKRFLLERQKHLVRERSLKRVIQGMDSPDGTEAMKATGYALEIVGLIGKAARAKPTEPTDPQLLADVAAEVDTVTDEQRREMATALESLAVALRNTSNVSVTERGELKVDAE